LQAQPPPWAYWVSRMRSRGVTAVTSTMMPRRGGSHADRSVAKMAAWREEAYPAW
jgi:hypothetical protein